MSHKYKLNVKYIKYLQKLPESGMGYQKVVIIFKNGERINAVVLNGEILVTEDRININNIIDIHICMNK